MEFNGSAGHPLNSAKGDEVNETFVANISAE
jgi:hypothetical protein